MAGLFISFEGGEGSGKSTQIKLLANWLAGEWPGKITQTREPGGTHGAERIRALLVRDDDAHQWDSTTEALLMTAARRDNVTRIIEPALAEGEAVLTDRFYDSTTVYQGIVGGVEAELVEMLNHRFLNELRPDFTLLLDIDPAIGLERSQRDGNNETRFEKRGLAFHQAVRQGFLDLAKAEPERFMVIDAMRNEMAIHEEIIAWLKPRLKAFG